MLRTLLLIRLDNVKALEQFGYNKVVEGLMSN